MNLQVGLLLFVIVIALITLIGIGLAVVTLIAAASQYRKNKRNFQARKARSIGLENAQRGTFPMLFLIGLFFLVVALSCMILMISGIFYSSNFQRGTCTIISKSMKSEKVTIPTGSHTEYNSTTGQYDTVNDTTDVPGFRAVFVLRVQSSNGSVYDNGQDIFHSASRDREAEQTLLDKYQIGKTYGCWYYRFDPAQASFSTPDSPQGVLFLLIPGVFFLFIGILLLKLSRLKLFVPFPSIGRK